MTTATATNKLALNGAGVGRRWLVGLPIAAIIILYWPSFFWLGRHWLDGGTYGHGPLLALLAAYYFWLALGRANDVSAPFWPAAIAIAGLSLVWLLAKEANVQIGQQVVLPLLMLAAFAMAFGLATARRFAFPILLLYLAIPIWDLINYPLQLMTAKTMGALFETLGRPVSIEETYVTVSAGVFRIADGCSGLRFMLVGGILALSYGYTEFDRWSTRLKFVAAALVLATVTNWIRVGWIIYLGDVTDMQHPWVADHVNIGWFMFAAAALFMIPVAARLHRQEARQSVQAQRIANSGATGRLPVKALVLSVAMLALAPAYSLLPKTVVASPENAVAQAPTPAGWQMGLSEAASPFWRPVFSDPDAESFGQYLSLGAIIHSYHVFYATQDQQRELIGQGSAIDGGLTSVERRRITVGDNSFMRIKARAADASIWLVYYAYWVGSKPQTSAKRMKLQEALYGLQRRSGSGLNAYAIACRDRNCDWAESTMNQFLDQIPLPTVARVTD
ncbi:MAG: exosortase C-terminal domain/associated protein EpsI [Pseudomonadota bacterium]